MHQVGNYYIVNSWCTVRKTSNYRLSCYNVHGTGIWRSSFCSRRTAVY